MSIHPLSGSIATPTPLSRTAPPAQEADHQGVYDAVNFTGVAATTAAVGAGSAALASAFSGSFVGFLGVGVIGVAAGFLGGGMLGSAVESLAQTLSGHREPGDVAEGTSIAGSITGALAGVGGAIAGSFGASVAGVALACGGVVAALGVACAIADRVSK